MSDILGKLTTTWAPVMEKSIGSKNIQKISKAVATGLSSSSQPISVQFLHAINANAITASGPVMRLFTD